MMKRTHVPCKVTGSTELRGAQCSRELSLKSTDFRAPENLIFPALVTHLYMSLFSSLRLSTPLSVRPSVRPSIVHLISGTVHYLIINFGTHV